MFRITLPIIGLALLVIPLPMMSATAVQEAPMVPQVSSFGPRKPASSMDIMRRVIVKSINRDMNEHFSDENDKLTSTVTTRETAPGVPLPSESFAIATSLYGRLATNSFAGDSRGYYIPGHGAVFSLEVTVPLIEAEPEETEDIEKPEKVDDLWTEATDEAEGRTSAFGRAVVSGTYLFNETKQTEWMINPEGVDLVINAVCATVAKHGKKIDDLQDDESVIVVLNVNPGQAVSTTGDTGAYRLFYSYSFAAGGSDETQQIVIEVTVEDLDRYAGDRIDLDGLKSRATITRR